MDKLTKKQEIFLNNLIEKYGNNILPSYETIAKDFNFKHKNSVFQYFKRFKELNILKEENFRYKICDKFFGAKIFTSSVRAGFATVIEDGFDGRISLDYDFKINSPSTFIFTVSGDSMVDLGIFEGDLVIIQKTDEAKDGDIVLANLDGGLTLKIFKKQKGKTFLRPANSSYPDMYPETSLLIFGVALGIVRKFS